MKISALRLIINVFLGLLMLLSAVFCACAAAPRIIDGDTIELSNGDTIRYLGIDTPERDQPLYAEARSFNMILLQGGSLRFESDVTDKDVYGRLLRYIYADDIFVNERLVREGYALVYSKNKFPDRRYFELLVDAEDEAALNKKGIWALDYKHPKIEKSAGDYYLPASVDN